MNKIWICSERPITIRAGHDRGFWHGIWSAWGHEGTRANEGSRIIYITEKYVRHHHLSMHRAQLLGHWLRLAFHCWPVSFISICFYLSKVTWLTQYQCLYLAMKTISWSGHLCTCIYQYSDTNIRCCIRCFAGRAYYGSYLNTATCRRISAFATSDWPDPVYIKSHFQRSVTFIFPYFLFDMNT